MFNIGKVNGQLVSVNVFEVFITSRNGGHQEKIWTIDPEPYKKLEEGITFGICRWGNIQVLPFPIEVVK